MGDQEQVAALARGWIEAWGRFDLDWLEETLAEDFVHVSAFGKLSGRADYLETVSPIAGAHKHKLVIQRVLADGDEAAVWFENHTPDGVVQTCDWVTVRDDQIVSVRSFFDTTLLREELSAEDLESLGGR